MAQVHRLINRLHQRTDNHVMQQVAIGPIIQLAQNKLIILWRCLGLGSEPNAHPAQKIVEILQRSEERLVGKECVRECGSRWAPDHEKKKKQKQHNKSIK